MELLHIVLIALTVAVLIAYRAYHVRKVNKAAETASMALIASRRRQVVANMTPEQYATWWSAGLREDALKSPNYVP